MDVILNRKMTPTAAAASGGSCGTAIAASGNRNEILFPPAHKDEDLEDKNNYKYRTLFAFLPGMGVLYSGTEWHRKIEGVEVSRAHLEMSWFQIWSMEEPPSMSEFCLRFGKDGNVKRFNAVSTGRQPGSQTVAACRVLYNIVPPTFSRVVFTLKKCADHDGPRMHPTWFWVITSDHGRLQTTLKNTIASLQTQIPLRGLAIGITLRDACS